MEAEQAWRRRRKGEVEGDKVVEARSAIKGKSKGRIERGRIGQHRPRKVDQVVSANAGYTRDGDG